MNERKIKDKDKEGEDEICGLIDIIRETGKKWRRKRKRKIAGERETQKEKIEDADGVKGKIDREWLEEK